MKTDNIEKTEKFENIENNENIKNIENIENIALYDLPQRRPIVSLGSSRVVRTSGTLPTASHQTIGAPNIIITIIESRKVTQI